MIATPPQSKPVQLDTPVNKVAPAKAWFGEISSPMLGAATKSNFFRFNVALFIVVLQRSVGLGPHALLQQ